MSNETFCISKLWPILCCVHGTFSACIKQRRISNEFTFSPACGIITCSFAPHTLQRNHINVSRNSHSNYIHTLHQLLHQIRHHTHSHTETRDMHTQAFAFLIAVQCRYYACNKWSFAVLALLRILGVAWTGIAASAAWTVMIVATVCISMCQNLPEHKV